MNRKESFLLKDGYVLNVHNRGVANCNIVSIESPDGYYVDRSAIGIDSFDFDEIVAKYRDMISSLKSAGCPALVFDLLGIS